MNRFFYSYLFSVPFVAAGIGFGIGGVPDKITIPVWILHSLIMMYMFRNLTRHKIVAETNEKSAAIFLFAPWVLFTIFAGFGPPPETPALWLTAIAQQQVRYFILASGAIISAIGF